MKLRTLTPYLTAALLALTAAAHAEILMDETPVEAETVRVVDDGRALEVAACAGCPSVRAMLTAASQVFLDGEAVHPSKLPRGRLLGLVIYTTEAHEVTLARLVRPE